MTTFQTISPIDNSILFERELASDKMIETALENSKKSQDRWRHSTISERANICRLVLEYFIKNAEEIGEEITRQMGRPIRYAKYEILGGFKERAEHMIEIASEALKDIKTKEKTGFYRFIRREPVGTVLVLAPWNYPYLTSVNVIIPAIMAGNAVILKHAQQTPLCAERYAAAFEYAGLPKGVFQYLHLSHEQVGKVIQDSRIDYVAFTGSVRGGEAVQSAVNQRFITAGLELGGKDPAYVCADAELDFTIENLVDGAFFNSGQSCCGIERIYVHETLFDRFLEGFVDLTRKYILDNPLNPETTLGPMVRNSAVQFAQKQIQEALQKGAKALIDKNIFKNFQPESAYMAPQVLVDVNHQMEIMKEETFAPVVGIMSVKNDDEAIRLMNDSKYGLTASVWTKNVQEAIKFGTQIQTGTFFMNRCDYLDPELAWTGVKNSGKGATLSKLGYESLTRPKSFHLRLC